jgi:hypothetical protein
MKISDLQGYSVVSSTAPVAPTQKQTSQPGNQTNQDGGFWGGVKDFTGGVIHGLSAPGRTIQNALSSAVDTVAGTHGFGKATDEGFQNSLGVNLQSTSGQIGNAVGETAPYLIQPGAEAAGLIGSAGRFAMNTAIGTAQSGDLVKGAEQAALGEGINIGGKLLTKVAKGVYNLAIPTSTKEAGLIQNYKANTSLLQRIMGTAGQAPRTAEDTAFSKGLKGTESMIGVQAVKEQRKIWSDIISPSLKSADTHVSMPEFFDELQSKIVSDNVEPTRQKALLEALDAMKEDYSGINLVSAERLQKYKEGWAKFVPDKAYNGKPIAGAFRDVQNEAAGLAREKILSAINDPKVKQAYLDYGNLYALKEWGKSAMTGGKFKGGTGGFISALKDMVVAPIATIGGRTIYRFGNGIQVVGQAGAKTLFDVLGAENSIANENTNQPLQ